MGKVNGAREVKSARAIDDEEENDSNDDEDEEERGAGGEQPREEFRQRDSLGCSWTFRGWGGGGNN